MNKGNLISRLTNPYINNKNYKTMKTMSFFKNNGKAIAAFMFAVSMTMCFTACDDDFIEAGSDLMEEAVTDFAAVADTYNINDAMNSFTTENWRDQEAVYIYDGQSSLRDTENRKGYMMVNLPWLQSDVMTNLPNGFCNDITRDNGWEMVLNRCGSRSIENNNFFVLYNKFTGTLRFFYYQPNAFQSGNDHLWETTMTDNMARNTTLRYGVPMNTRIWDKSDIGQTATDGTITEYITPWVGRPSTDGLITPNTGWWAFDVDLSLYSGKGLNDDDNIRLQMRSWEASHVSLSSLLTAKIDGSIKANVDLLQSQHLGNSMLGILTKVGTAGGSAYSMISALQSAKWSDAFGAAMNMGKTIANMAGIKTEAAHDIEGTIDGTIALGMTGEIETSGTISASKITPGIVSPKFFLKDFDLSNSPGLGEGIWNLRKSPVVYYTNASVDWKYEHNGKESCNWLDKYSPFKGQINQGQVTDSPYHGRVCYFDPSSVDVVLNPNVFSEEERSKAKVYAVCGVRHSLRGTGSDKSFGSTEGYRNAMKLKPSILSGKARYDYSNRPFTEAPFDALSNYSEKMNMKANTQFDTETYDGHKYGVFGCGDADYLIEPQALAGKDAPEMMPAYEVTVTVVVEHEGKPIVFCRSYLPEYDEITIESMPDITTDYINRNMPDNYMPEIYSRQMQHIKDIRNWTRRTLIPTGGTPCHMPVMYTVRTDSHEYTVDKNQIQVSLTESYPTLFDNDLTNRWVGIYENVKFTFWQTYGGEKTVVSERSVDTGVWNNYPCWYVEFKSNLPISPTSYTLFSANDAGTYPQCNPQVWYLYGKRYPGGPWIKLASSSFNNQPEDMLPKASSKPTRNIPFRLHECKDMQYFRFEVQKSDNTNAMIRLGEIRFNYDD